ncbi:MAG: hypothetical protein J6T39_00620 [Clostridia bacterium]|nr:hypothetical protein [Clostridia bacterium]
MTTVYIVLGIFALIIVYIAVMYAVNSHKINKKKSKPAEKAEKPSKSKDNADNKKDDGEKKKEPEFRTEFVDYSPKEAAMQQSYEDTKQKELAGMEDFSVPKRAIADDEMTELERALYESGKKRRYGLEKSIIEQKHMRSETNKIGVEGPSQKADTASADNKNSNENDGIDASKLSDDAKKILIADIINKKY